MKEKKKSNVLSFRYLIYDLIRIFASPSLLFFRPKKIYISEKAKTKMRSGVLIISNHISLFDPMYLLMGIWRRRLRFVAMDQMFKTKFKNWFLTKCCLCIPIDREHFSIKSFKEIVNHLENGEAVTIFPEGHVNVNEEGVQAFKGGMVMMALRSGTPIVPVYILRRKHWYSRLVIGVGESVNANEFKTGERLSLEDVDKASQFLHEQEVELEKLCTEKYHGMATK